MTDYWSGPRELESITGLCDSAVIVDSSYGKKRVKLALLDVVVRYSDGTSEEKEQRDVFVAAAGTPGSALAKSIRSVAKLPPKDKDGKPSDVLGAIVGRLITLAVSKTPFKTQDGEQKEMDVYRVTAIADTGASGASAPPVHEDDVLDYLIGKTPADAGKGRAQFNGTEFADILASRTKTMAYFTQLSLVDGKYSVKVPA